MTSIKDLRAKLGPVSEANASEYFGEFVRVDDWDEDQALEWIQIFSEEDDNDYTGLAWDIIKVIDKQIDPAGLRELRKLNSYWARVASYGK